LFHWYGKDPVAYPLPNVLQAITPDKRTYYERLALGFEDFMLDDLDRAADEAWEMIPPQLRMLMLICFNIRATDERNQQAHPIPSIKSATSFFSDDSIPMSDFFRSLANRLVIEAVTKPKSGSPGPNYAFHDTEGERAKRHAQGDMLDWLQVIEDFRVEESVAGDTEGRGQVGDEPISEDVEDAEDAEDGGQSRVAIKRKRA
jgi:hypothetical protein